MLSDDQMDSLLATLGIGSPEFAEVIREAVNTRETATLFDMIVPTLLERAGGHVIITRAEHAEVCNRHINQDVDITKVYTPEGELGSLEIRFKNAPFSN